MYQILVSVPLDLVVVIAQITTASVFLRTVQQFVQATVPVFCQILVSAKMDLWVLIALQAFVLESHRLTQKFVQAKEHVFLLTIVNVIPDIRERTVS